MKTFVEIGCCYFETLHHLLNEGWRGFMIDPVVDYLDKLPKKQNGGEMKYYQEGLDWKPKTISKNGSVIKDDMGQWAHPGEITEISSPDITMQGVNYPVLGISDTGDTKMMKPGQDYKFDGKKVTEFPMMQKGGWLEKFAREPMRQDATRNIAFEQPR